MGCKGRTTSEGDTFVGRFVEVIGWGACFLGSAYLFSEMRKLALALQSCRQLTVLVTTATLAIVLQPSCPICRDVETTKCVFR